MKNKYAEINGEWHRRWGDYPQHVCLKAEYPYYHVYKKDKGEWRLEIDNQSDVRVFFCPFCGKELPI